MLRVGLLLLAAMVVWPVTVSADPLPPVSNRDPVAVPHFPSPLHTVVWRNWGLVPTQRLAHVLRGSEAEITEVAVSLGLPAEVTVPPEMDQRGYMTLLRRNWHLLPYEQLAPLLEISAEELAFRLQEDDFLYIKLGSIKPKCDPVFYAQPTAEMNQRAADIRKLVVQDFGHWQTQEGLEPLFDFIKQLSIPPEDAASAPSATAGSDNLKSDDLRYVYSYFAVFGDPLIDPELDPYPDGLLARLQQHGVNGIWLHTVLRQLVPPSEHFPGVGEGHQQRLATLTNLVERAQKYGIRVYLYMNEPRAMPIGMMKSPPVGSDLQYIPMCTSRPEVLGWVENSMTYLFEQVPNLGGVFTISGSENPTHCASHGRQDQCPLCSQRTSTDIQAELLTAIERGVHRAAPDARVIVWDWGWFNKAGNPAEIIPQLPKSVWYQSVSEWALPIERGGVKGAIGEYSISAPGPGPRATENWKIAKEHGLKTVAKVQFNNTWELSTVPYIPALDLVAQHCSNLKQAGVDGLMLSWSLGGYPSKNLEVAQQFWASDDAQIDSVLNQIAVKHFGETAAPEVRKAWTAFSQAFQEYPYHISVVYRGPQQVGPGNLLHWKPTGYTSTMVGFPYDDLQHWRGTYPEDVFLSQFQKVATGWKQGLKHLQAALEHVPEDRRATAEADLRVATAAGLHFQSVANQIEFIIARNALQNATDQAAKQQKLDAIQQIVEAEKQVARQLFDLSLVDSRLGYEASNHYAYVPQDLIEKVISCQHLQQTELGAKSKSE